MITTDLKIKFLKPFETAFIQTSETELSNAACSLLGEHTQKALFITPTDAGRDDGETSYFSLMQGETGEPFVARYFYSGIGRTGGVKKPRNPLQCATIKEVEDRLGVKPGHLDCDWQGEESVEQVWEKRRHACAFVSKK